MPPDPNCSDCKGTGKITLLTSIRDCGCEQPESKIDFHFLEKKMFEMPKIDFGYYYEPKYD
jgi:hypothetical protein